MSPEFLRGITRAQVCLDHVGVVPAYLDAGVMQFMGAWGGMVADLI